MAFALILLVLCFVDLWAATQHLRVEAKTGSVEIGFSPGHPIAWALGGARLLDCWQLAKLSERGGASNVKNPQATIEDEAEIELAAVRARISLNGNDLVVELRPLAKPNGDTTGITPECSKDAGRVAVLDTGDGIRRGISLPAQLRLGHERIGDGLTLEFRGALSVGNDVSSSRQPLLTSGRLTLREVRSHWLQTFADAQFDVESRDLGLGDKVTLPLGKVSEDAPQGFVHIVKGEKSTEMSVYATAVAEGAKIVRPFSPPESPRANWFRRVWADEVLSKLVASIVAMVAFGIRFFLAPNKNAQHS